MHAAAAAAFNFFLPFQGIVGPAQLRQHLRRGPRLGVPQIGKQVVLHIAQRDGLPELVRVHHALRVNVGDAAAGAVRPAAVPLKKVQGFLRQRGAFPELAQQQVNAVRWLGDGQHFTVFAVRLPFLYAGNQRIHGVPRFLLRQRLHFHASARGHQMVEADALDVIGVNEVQNLVHALHVVAGQRQAQARLLPHFTAELEPAHRLFKGAFHSAELVMNGADAVQGNAHVRHAQFLEPRGGLRRDAGAVRGNGHFQPFSSGPFQQLHEARVHQRFPAGEQQGVHLVVRQIVNDRAALVPIQLPFKFPGGGVRIAMHALEVAGARDVPDHNGLADAGRSRSAGFHGASRGAAVPVALPVSQMVRGLFRPCPKSGNVNHGIVKAWADRGRGCLPPSCLRKRHRRGNGSRRRRCGTHTVRICLPVHCHPGV